MARGWLWLAVALAVAPAWASMTVKTTASTLVLGAEAADDAVSFPHRDTVDGHLRLRFNVGWRLDESWDATLAYEQQAHYAQQLSQQYPGLLPEMGTPYRLTPLLWKITSADTLSYRHQVDRLSMSWHTNAVEMSLGRQALTLGPAQLFNTVDVYAPLAPLALDREWRTGVDAATLEGRYHRLTLGGLTVYGEDWAHSALLARAGYTLGHTNLTLLAGKHNEDTLAAMTALTSLGAAEVHAEGALFRIPDTQVSATGVPGWQRTVPKWTLGGSYQAPTSTMLRVLAEYHYSGFGARNETELGRIENYADFLTRLQRGDTQIAGRQALGLRLDYVYDDQVSLGFTAIASPQDGSGVLLPAGTYTNRTWGALTAGVALPFGTAPSKGVRRSEYGSTPLAVYLKWRMDM
jgi:hypothetical protein